MKDVGIAGYGAYIPKFRIKVDEIARSWGRDADSLKKSLCVNEKAVPGIDEDSATMAVEASKHALSMGKVQGSSIQALFIGSESHPYAVKPTATIVAEALRLSRGLFSADLEFACQAGTSSMQIVYSMIKSGMIGYGLAIGTDVAQANPNDALECTASAGSASMLLGSENILARIEATYSFTTDTPDFWRRQNQPYPKHGGQFTGKPAYYRHIVECTQKIMEMTSSRPDDFAHVVFHQPNGKFPVEAARMLGFTERQTQNGLLVREIGNCYSASSLIGLCSVLDEAESSQRILLVSYGSGAGADGFVFEATGLLPEARKSFMKVKDMMKNTVYLPYEKYARQSKKYA
ncbi:hydroxymethylglutaryl-CoA synthase [Candidatus Woesearchaeota archaeon]|nr:hydroxymethylglutaryl-CoA synthase [Candidatus Woesearchaeota archaeon]